MVGVAKRPKAPDCGSGIRGFESHHPPHKKSSRKSGGIFYGLVGGDSNHLNATVQWTVAAEGLTEANIHLR